MPWLCIESSLHHKAFVTLFICVNMLVARRRMTACTCVSMLFKCYDLDMNIKLSV